MGNSRQTHRGSLMKLVKGIVLLCLVLTLQACSKPDVTGSYVFTDPTTIDYITLAQSPDGHVKGQQIFASTSWVDVSGFAQQEWRLSGTIKDGVLNLTLTSPRSPESTPMVGTFDGRSLLLTTLRGYPMRYIAITPERYAVLRHALIAGQKLESTAR